LRRSARAKTQTTGSSRKLGRLGKNDGGFRIAFSGFEEDKEKKEIVSLLQFDVIINRCFVRLIHGLSSLSLRRQKSNPSVASAPRTQLSPR
jgi:hypothetical protein